MVARVIIRIAAQNVEHQAREQLFERCLSILELVPNYFGQILIAGISGHHFVKP